MKNKYITMHHTVYYYHGIQLFIIMILFHYSSINKIYSYKYICPSKIEDIYKKTST